ncbi:MAG: type II secretion system F family protein [Gammaproteobacteria bacterium]|jgi:MSHA biogenesis protein MshG
MPTFQYKARGQFGDAVEGVMEAASTDGVATQLIGSGLTPVDIRPVQVESVESGGLARLFPPRVTLIDLIQFCRQMHSLLKAGVPILNSLAGLTAHTPNKTLARTLEGVMEGLGAGRDLSSSLARFPDVFSMFFVSLVRVGETSGRLEEVFHQLVGYLEREHKTRERIRAATRYPLFVLAAITAAIAIINVVVIPAFANLFRQFNAELPLPTRILIAMSDITVNHWELLLGFALLAGAAIRIYLGSDAGRYRWHRLQLRLPLVGNILYQATLARFSRLLALVQNSGIPIVTGLSVVARAIDNKFVEERVLSMRDGVERGESLSNTAARTGVFDPLVLQMLRVGEQSGATDELLREVADYYDSTVDYALERLGASIEPTLTIVLAVLAFLLATGVFLPMWDIAKVTLH